MRTSTLGISDALRHLQKACGLAPEIMPSELFRAYMRAMIISLIIANASEGNAAVADVLRKALTSF